MTAKLAALLARAASRLGATLDPRRRESIASWLARLEEWNARMDLTAARTQEELVDLMVADALVLAANLSPRGSVVDVGSGAGAPGLALALLRPDLRVTLVEPKAKRASFLRTVIGEVGREDVMIESARGEAIADRSSSWNVAMSRATLRPTEWLDLGTKLVAPGGSVWVFVAKRDAPRHARATMESDVAYEWPLTGVRRRALQYRTLR
jgi:16S rRNA (guanine527-N7)-methyltransferase